MAVALDHLRGDRRRLQAKSLTNLLFKLRLQMGKRSNGTREFSHAHFLGATLEALNVAYCFRVPVGQLQPKRRWLGMYAMGSTNRRRVLKLMSAAGQHLFQLFQVFRDDL